MALISTEIGCNSAVHHHPVISLVKQQEWGKFQELPPGENCEAEGVIKTLPAGIHKQDLD